MLEKLKGLFGRNKKELKKIEEKKDEYADFSRDALKDRKYMIQDANELITNLDKANSKYEEEKKNGASELRLEKLKEKVAQKEHEVKRQSQGKLKSLIGAYFGQIDKKIHNSIYFRESLSSDKLWNYHCNSINNRYENMPGYLLKNGLAVLTMTGITMALNIAGIPSANFLSHIFMGLNALIVANTGVKVASTIYNKKKFGGPLLRQFEPILTGTYKENILNAHFDLIQSRELTNATKYIGEVPRLIEANKNNEEIIIDEPIQEEKLPVPQEEIVEEKIQEELVEPNINDYGNINFGIFKPLSKFQDDPEEKLSYSKSVSLLRKVDMEKADDDNFEKKIAAYDKLYGTFGKGKPKKKKITSNAKLNDYNKTLKLLAEYGRKVHTNTATQKEINTYWGLLYHLGKDDDFIGDFLADEYDRYQEDKKKYEEKKLIKKM